MTLLSSDILFWLFFELRLATGGTEVIGLVLVDGRTVLLIHVHAHTGSLALIRLLLFSSIPPVQL
jgi:hypothetical protein